VALAFAAPSPLTSWTFDPLQLAPILVGGFLYYRRVATLRARGLRVASWRPWTFGAGLLMLAIALVTPLDAFAEQQFLSAHMLQHVLLGDLAPLAIVAGLTGPILRPILSIRWLEALRVLAHPLVALPLWAVSLCVWHLPYLYEAALHHGGVHALEHLCFFTFGALMWAAVVEVLPGPAWFGTGLKLGYIVVVRLVETVLGNVFIWSGQVFYPFYEHPTDLWGISAKADKGIAGALMMIEGSIVTIAALAWLFLRLAQEGELRQRLIEAGTDPAVASRAVRYGRGEELASRR
jgi:cytochrome c oxidase assembly factor CtaG